jgi:hypothetical protein
MGNQMAHIIFNRLQLDEDGEQDERVDVDHEDPNNQEDDDDLETKDSD